MSSLDEASVWRLRTFVVPPDALDGRAVVVEGAEHRHAFGVVRARVGDDVRLIDGEGTEVLARVDAASESRASFSVMERRKHERDDGVSLTIVQSLPKGRGMDEVVRRCAELGVASIVPVVSERTVSRPDVETAERRLERWRAVALAAVKQSRGVFLTNVEPLAALDEVGALVSGSERAFVAWEEEGGVSLLSALGRAPKPRSLLAVVGPEGGLSSSEVEALGAMGAEPVGLSRRVLRADWAAAALAAMASHSLGGLLP